MGTDKALIEIDGRSLAARVADALVEAGASTVAAVGGNAVALTDLGLSVHPDPTPGAGPLGGVIGALRLVGGQPTVIVLSCDLLRPAPELIARLVAERQRLGVDLVVPVAAGRPQWAHGVWRRAAIDLLETSFAAGERSLVAAAASLRCTRVDVDDSEMLDDADVPSDLPPGPSIGT